MAATRRLATTTRVASTRTVSTSAPTRAPSTRAPSTRTASSHTASTTAAGAGNRAAGPLAALPNLGPASTAMLEAAGLRSLVQLRRLGAVAAYLEVKRVAPHASLNLLWALEGAITGRPWQQVAREQRSDLLMALAAAQDAPQHLVATQTKVTRAAAAAPSRTATPRAGVCWDDVERFAMSLPEVTQAPHHHFGSLRVRGKIFVTVPPGFTHLHVFVTDERRDEFLALHAECCEPLRWGSKVVGLRITLAQARLDAVHALVRCAWEAKAPKRLLASM